MAYNTASYGMMIQDDVRLDAFTSALRRAITPGETTVLDIGTGTGIMAFVAATAGAKRVYGVEPNPAIEVAREIVRLNGLGDRVELHKALSTEVDLPPCDVVISDLRGRLPLFEGHIPAIVDARQRLLVPGGRLIAARDVLYAAAVQTPATWWNKIGYWDDNVAGVDMTPAKRLTANTIFDFDRQPADLLSAPLELAQIDYRTVETPHLSTEGRLRMDRDGTLHGLSLWFDIVLDEQTRLSNGLGEPRLVYGRPFLGVLDPLDVRRGEQLEFEVRARRVQSDYIWSWSGGIVGNPGRSFSQSTFDGADVSPVDFASFRLDAAPARSRRGEHVATVLAAMDGETTIEELAEHLMRRWADVSDRDEAIDLVSAVVAEFGGTR